MPSLADWMRNTGDRIIFGAIGETMVFGSNEVKGIFFKRYRVVELQDGSIASFDLSFDCQFNDVNTLVEGDEVTIGNTAYIFRRCFPEHGDETTKVTVDLATKNVTTP